jgi:hypothetical protein
MLHDPARHERLADIPWDESHARAAIARIVRETVQAFTPEGWWPPHPRDLNPGDDPATPATPLYFGAAGVVWALRYLRAVGAADAPSYAGHLDAMLLANRRWLATMGDVDAAGSYLMGDLPIEMMAWEETPTAERADRIAALIEANIDHPARELMWGSPGSLLAAAMMQRRTGDERWALLFRRIAARLREQLQWVPAQACHLWTQDLYGRRSRYLDAVHGFVATASALIQGRHLLGANDWAEWQRCIEQTIANTAWREDGMASWPVEADEPADRPQKRLMQFCHGAPGFVICLAHLPGTALDALLLEAGEATWAAGPLAKGSNLCHGTGGNGYAFLVLHARTGDARWLARARAFAMHGIAQMEREAQALGRRRHSLWTGDPGFAIYLWDCIREKAAFPTLDVFFGSPPEAPAFTA